MSISGLRGVLGDGLEPSFLCEFAAGVGTLAEGGTVVVSSDGRSTAAMVRHAVISGLLATGCRVLDVGVQTTPTCGVLVTHLGAAGGIQITASHNPIEWNGLKPFSPQGSVYDEATGRRLLEIIENQTQSYVSWDRIGTVETIDDPAAPHLERVLALVDVARIRETKLKVVLDCNHGSGAVAGPRLLESLGCEVVVQGGTPDGQFSHPRSPTISVCTPSASRVPVE